jgi:CRP-like cAMP-binding protein
MSMVMWDMLTGGAPYREVLQRALKPVFLIRFLWSMIVSLFPRNENAATVALRSSFQHDEDTDNSQTIEDNTMKLNNALGKVYEHGEVILRKGEAGDYMFVIQDGQVEILGEFEGQEVRLAVGQAGEVIGEMAIFERQTRSATVRALGKARVLTIDEKTFLRYVHQDPSLAYQLLKMMSNRVRKLNSQLTYFKVIQRLAEKDIFPLPTSQV